jgi:hypothetical protein
MEEEQPRRRHSFTFGDTRTDFAAVSLPRDPNPPAPAQREEESVAEVGLRQQGGSYKHNKGSDLYLWHGNGCALDAAMCGPFKHIYLYGALVRGSCKYFFGHGDTILVDFNDEVCERLCLGFAEKKGKSYTIIVNDSALNETDCVARDKFTGICTEKGPADSEECKQLLEAFVGKASQKRAASEFPVVVNPFLKANSETAIINWRGAVSS